MKLHSKFAVLNNYGYIVIVSNHKGLSITHPCFQLPDPNYDIAMGDKILKGKVGHTTGGVGGKWAV